MPKRIPNPNPQEENRWNRNTLLEFTLYFNYEKNGKSTRFEGKARLTIGQLYKFGGQRKLERFMDDILYDTLGISSEEFNKTPIGFDAVKGEPSRFGTWKIWNVNTGVSYPKDKWGSLSYVWR